MLYEVAHWVQKHCPWMWEGVELLNAGTFVLRYGGKRRLQQSWENGIRLATVEDAVALAAFFTRQPEDAYRWFRPHGFDEATLRRLLKRGSYVIYVMEEQGEIIGYAFLRCFVNGKCFLGKMVDMNHQGKGVCTKLCKVGMDMATALGLRMFESINKANIGSMKASQKACEVIVVEELENGDVLIEDRPKGSSRP